MLTFLISRIITSNGISKTPSSVNVKLSAARKLVDEAKRVGVVGADAAAEMTEVPNIREQGTRLGNWLTRDQARDLLRVPDRSTLKGKRDYAILALPAACALRRRELAALDAQAIQMRENRWVIADLRGKGGRVRTVAVPLWVKQGIDALTSTDLSKKTEAWLLLLTFPLCLACVFDLVLASRFTGRARVAIIVWSSVGIVLNVGFFIAAGISD